MSANGVTIQRKLLWLSAVSTRGSCNLTVRFKLEQMKIIVTFIISAFLFRLYLSYQNPFVVGIILYLVKPQTVIVTNR
jgi:hypothetical protein